MNKIRFNTKKYGFIKVMPLFKINFKDDKEKRDYAEEVYKKVLNECELDMTKSNRHIPYIMTVLHDDNYCYLINCTKDEDKTEILTIYINKNDKEGKNLNDLKSCLKFLSNNAEKFINNSKTEVLEKKNVEA